MANEDSGLPQRQSALGITVLIVGGGVAGLMAALEMWRQGIDVKIIERSPSRLTAGDGFTISHSVLRVFNKWPYLKQKNKEISWHPWLAWYNFKGERQTEPRDMKFTPSKEDEINGVDGLSPEIYRHSRPKFHQMLETQLEQTGIKVQYGKRAIRYFENPEKRTAGVELEGGELLEADLVVAADGIGSHSTKITMGHEIHARSTGISIYRTAYPIEIVNSDPDILKNLERAPNGAPIVQIWTGDDVSATFGRNDDEVTWSINHRIVKGSSESWSKHVSVEEVLANVPQTKEWPVHARRIIEKTPKDKLIDFELVWRDPQPVWTSSSGLVVQIGDAAHTFLPSSGNGANQALEDAVSLAKCLRIAGKKESIPEATKVHNKLRYERVECLQKLGICNQATQYGQKDHGVVSYTTRPKYVRMLVAPWTWKHDPEKYAEEKYHEALSALKNGTPFQNTNIPRGYVHKPWTFESLLKEVEEKGYFEFEGEWEN